jgi:hypothetical protein
MEVIGSSEKSKHAADSLTSYYDDEDASESLRGKYNSAEK